MDIKIKNKTHEIIYKLCEDKKDLDDILNKEDFDFISDLNFDSLLFVTLFLEIEQEFNIELSEEVYLFDNIRKSKDLIKYIKKALIDRSNVCEK